MSKNILFDYFTADLDNIKIKYFDKLEEHIRTENLDDTELALFISKLLEEYVQDFFKLSDLYTKCANEKRSLVSYWNKSIT